MTSQEERREVAERLRKASAHRQSIRCYAVDKALGLWYDDSYFGSVFASESVLRLADLIDPTCHVIIPNEMDGECFCSECGALLGEYGYTMYCPSCGARVVGA